MTEQLKKPIRFIGQVIRSPGFLDAESKPDATIETSFARAAFNLLDEPESTEWSPLDERAVNVIATLPAAVEAQQWLGYSGSRSEKNVYLNEDDRDRWIDQIMPFNKALRELLMASPDVTIDYIIDLAESVTTQLYPDRETAEQVINFTRRRAVGMLYEVIAEQSLPMIRGVKELLPTTPEEDKQGVDFKVVYGDENPRVVKLDTKSSARMERKARENGYNSGDVIPVYLGIPPVEFNGSTKLSAEQRKVVCTHLEAALQDMNRYQRA
jgi:hypothetical protein